MNEARPVVADCRAGDALLAELIGRLPEGAAPVGLVEAMERVGAVSYTPK